LDLDYVLADDEREVRLVERLGLNLQEVRVIDAERTINYDGVGVRGCRSLCFKHDSIGVVGLSLMTIDNSLGTN
jgi:hypothetical protein